MAYPSWSGHLLRHVLVKMAGSSPARTRSGRRRAVGVAARGRGGDERAEWRRAVGVAIERSEWRRAVGVAIERSGLKVRLYQSIRTHDPHRRPGLAMHAGDPHQRLYRSRPNVKTIPMSEATGRPSFTAGMNRQRITASSAARSSST
jgi:hypothetical protein